MGEIRDCYCYEKKEISLYQKTITEIRDIEKLLRENSTLSDQCRLDLVNAVQALHKVSKYL